VGGAGWGGGGGGGYGSRVVSTGPPRAPAGAPPRHVGNPRPFPPSKSGTGRRAPKQSLGFLGTRDVSGFREAGTGAAPGQGAKGFSIHCVERAGPFRAGSQPGHGGGGPLGGTRAPPNACGPPVSTVPNGFSRLHFFWKPGARGGGGGGRRKRTPHFRVYSASPGLTDGGEKEEREKPRKAGSGAKKKNSCAVFTPARRQDLRGSFPSPRDRRGGLR